MGSPIVSKVMTISENPALESNNQLLVHLDTNETVELSGKYIYQVTIKDAEGNVEIPKQGILLITKNIDKGFISDPLPSLRQRVLSYREDCPNEYNVFFKLRCGQRV